jgi:hypothetical protein
MNKLLKATAVATVGSMVLMLALSTDGARAVAQGMKPLLVQITNTTAEPVPVISAVDHVLLLMQSGAPTGDCPDFAHEVRRVLPDGTIVAPFTVPPGKRLVLTDLQAVVREQFNVPWSVGDIASVDAFVGSVSSTVIRAFGPVNGDAVANKIVYASVHLQSGGVIGSNSAVCLAQRIDIPSGGKAARLQQARLHGYLIAE